MDFFFTFQASFNFFSNYKLHNFHMKRNLIFFQRQSNPRVHLLMTRVSKSNVEIPLKKQ